ncbi:MAG: PLP-dependent transferase [Clostridia bacterium]|nr:PLP-dependent transferase [Clostridia bacterium]
MNTPICDFVKKYSDSAPMRLHMPGHKGFDMLGFEHLDITEISGADSLFEADGIIAESERLAGEIFDALTYYSTEGSSLCIRAMVHLALMQAQREGKAPLIAAGRNAHRAFMSACALSGADAAWIYPKNSDSYLSCPVTAQDVAEFLDNSDTLPCAVYLTSPDYLGNTVDIAAISAVCRSRGVMLLVDNAHGAYLRFLHRHPIELGADMCCDSAHKTLPVLTGGAYLHLRRDIDRSISDAVRSVLALYGSTSPSYLILQSLDCCNKYLSDTFPRALRDFVPLVRELKGALRGMGYTLFGDEELKLTISAKPYGYRGKELAKMLENKNIHAEASDDDFVVFMLSPLLGEECIDALFTNLRLIRKRLPIAADAPKLAPCERAMSIREASLAPCETVRADKCLGRVLAQPSVSCPPAVPIAICGERLSEQAIAAFKYYKTDYITVVKERKD